MISLRFYRIYDIGREIDIDWLEKSLARNYFTARTSFVPGQAQIYHDRIVSYPDPDAANCCGEGRTLV